MVEHRLGGSPGGGHQITPRLTSGVCTEGRSWCRGAAGSRSRVSTLGTGVWHRNPSSSGWWRRWCVGSGRIPGGGYDLGGA